MGLGQGVSRNFLKNSSDDPLFVRDMAQLVPTAYDQIDLTYTGTKVATATYKQAGVTVATLTLTYTGENLTSVVRT